MDHPDYFTDLADLSNRFKKLLVSLGDSAIVIYHQPDDIIGELVKEFAFKKISYGITGWQALEPKFTASGLEFSAKSPNESVSDIKLPLFGKHNLDNALAAIAVAQQVGISPDQIRRAFAGFKGTYRRFAVRPIKSRGVYLIDDYAHHPTAVRTTIEAARLHFGGRCIAVFQPHTYSRTKELLTEFKEALATADMAFVVDIEGAREKTSQAEVSSRDLEDTAKKVFYLPGRQDLIGKLNQEVKPQDVVLFMSVSGFNNFAEELASVLDASAKPISINIK
jgi:UDP-N-acetylmuramate--alanine ligase